MANPMAQLLMGGGGFGGFGAQDQAALQDINMRQQMAQMLMQRAQQQPQAQMVGGRYIPPNPGQTIANALSGLSGYAMMKDTNKQIVDLLKQQDLRMQGQFGLGQQQPGAQAFPVGPSGSTQQTPPSRPQASVPLLPGMSAEQSYNIARQVGMPAYLKMAMEGQNSYAPQQSTSGFFQVGPGGVKILTDPNTGKPLMPVTADPGTAGSVAQARAFGTETGKTQAQDMASAPQELAIGDQTLKTLDDVLNHPGLDAAVGAIQGRLPPMTPDAVDFNARLQQLQGQTFMQAYQSLKGGGQITEVEGQKAEAAIASLTRAQSEEQFRAALNEFRSVIQGARDRIAKRAGIPTDQSSASAPQAQPTTPSAAPSRDQQLNDILGF